MNRLHRSASTLAITALVVSLSLSACSNAPSDDAAAKEIVEKFLVDVWSKGDLKTADEILTSDFQFILAFAKTEDIEAFKKMVTVNREAFQNLTYEPLAIVVDGDKASARWKMTSKHVGTWRDVPGTGKDVSIEGITMFEFNGNKLARAWVQNDVIGLMQQIGGVEMTAQKKKNIDLVTRYVNDILIKRDFSTFNNYAAADFHIDRSAVPEGITGKEGLNTQMDMLYKAFPDMDLKMADIVAQDDKVLVRFEGPGTQTGEFAGIPATNKKATWKGLVLYQVKDGKLVHAWAVWDDYGLLMQLRGK